MNTVMRILRYLKGGLAKGILLNRITILELKVMLMKIWLVPLTIAAQNWLPYIYWG